VERDGCGQQQIAGILVRMELIIPFDNWIAALVLTLRYNHGISYSQMQQMMTKAFGLGISEGAIANILSRVKGQLVDS
jgi:transposase